MKKIYQCPAMETMEVRFATSMLQDSVPGEHQQGSSGQSFTGPGAPKRRTSPF